MPRYSYLYAQPGRIAQPDGEAEWHAHRESQRAAAEPIGQPQSLSRLEPIPLG